MTVSYVEVKLRKDYVRLVEDIYSLSQSVVSSEGESLEWLQYAAKKGSGYVFLPNRKKHWFILHKIAREVGLRNPKFRFGFIVDEISHRVNTTVFDEVVQAGLACPESLSTKEREYVGRTLITLDVKTLLHGYPWLLRNKKNGRKLIYKDIVGGLYYQVEKVVKGEFIFYKLKNIS